MAAIANNRARRPALRSGASERGRALGYLQLDEKFDTGLIDKTVLISILEIRSRK